MRQTNVVLVMVDDLRPLLSSYGDPHAQTPNFDRLAERGVVMSNAYSQISLCAPSRASILTGLRPDTLECYVNEDQFRDARPDAVTLPEAFSSQGYRTISIGKVFDARNRDSSVWDVELLPSHKKSIYALQQNREIYQKNSREYQATRADERQGMWLVGPAYEAASLDALQYYDGRIVSQAIHQLRNNQNQPFFLSVGFIKPHLPFTCPLEYWDLYDRDQFDLPLPRQRPVYAPALPYHEGFELRLYDGIPHQAMLSDELTRTLMHGYYACVSFVDAMLGRLIDEIDRLDLAANTIIVVTGDHGYHLGEKELWCKFTAFREASHTPLLVIDPNSARKGEVSAGLVELVDLFPTICELAGVSMPDDLEGTSFVPLLKEPERAWKDAVYSLAGRGAGWKGVIGRSMRTANFSYVEWRHRLSGELCLRELYDLREDPAETINLIDDPRYSDVLFELASAHRAGWLEHVPSVDL
ncbi:sulfatase [Thalassobacterium sedimentorum]|nr:sulfatase [Coraliomargarita sp. SDUM461004]